MRTKDRTDAISIWKAINVDNLSIPDVDSMQRSVYSERQFITDLHTSRADIPDCQVIRAPLRVCNINHEASLLNIKYNTATMI